MAAWIAGDPDPRDRAELSALPPGGPELAARFAAPLAFGTAGLRGPLRAGPAGMNTAVVLRATAGLASHLLGRGESGAIVVVGRDARHGSAGFARAAAEVLAAAGFDVVTFPEPLPTPVTAFAVRALGAAAGVQITASHNPAGDNGYKVYLRGGAQIVPPADRAIEEAIAEAGPAAEIPRTPLPEAAHRGSAEPDPRCAALVERYLERASRVLAGVGADGPLRVALSPVHGVGGAVAVAALRRAGFTDVHVVDEQFAPDPDFPTAPRPNPEEPGVADRLLALARRVDADVAIALDPDADRCALGVPGRDGWRMLRGDETGPLLGEHILRAGGPATEPVSDPASVPASARLVATTIVSSTLLGRIAAAHGARFRTTLTGFKWLARAADDVPGARLVYAYEEAIGMCVDPDAVADKDGISAAVALCRMAAMLRADGRSIADELDRLAGEYGMHAGRQISVAADRPGVIDALMHRLRRSAPSRLGGVAVHYADFAQRADGLRTDALVFASPDDAGGPAVRLVIRPSGTEPKVKAYAEVSFPPVAAQGAPALGEETLDAEMLDARRADADALLRSVADDARRLLTP
ncbi:phospho-sugar mutase [Tomitella fengzijianii]|uniref:Phospho-sugar mutase n=1 Tax=Tomitella fengzijianii TaxID=2597660 RepID=A0A516X8Q7_9ACTN|nr:phospho-sugar mutase [Tomitella fengzijianii]